MHLQYADQPAQSCASTDVVPIVLDGSPSAAGSCNTQTSKGDGQEVGANGTISLMHSEGTSSSTTSTVTKTSSRVEVVATVSFPEIVDITSKFTLTGTFTNTLSTATETKSDQTSSATVTQNNVAGKTCHLETCTVTGTGKLRMLGTGWVWFEYNDKTQDHYKWALNIDQTLTNQDDRSTFIEFKTSTGRRARRTTRESALKIRVHQGASQDAGLMNENAVCCVGNGTGKWLLIEYDDLSEKLAARYPAQGVALYL
ncbi:hypothetical protein FB451DRAFT_1389542 [Mycena latifolia]|nr:hypothetical protein FB451DRAFT_1389542 [Mycena latifolia]